MAEEDKKTSISFLKDLLKGQKESTKKPIPWYLIVILFFGIALMIFGTINKTDVPEDDWNHLHHSQDEVVKTGAKPEGKDSFTEKEMEERLADMLTKISGIENATVMVTFEGSEKKEYEKNSYVHQQTTKEKDQEGGSRTVEDGEIEEEMVVLQKENREEPVLYQTKNPDIRGVLVVAEGVENTQIKEWVVEAVTRVMDVAPHKVSVLPKEKGKE
ncbi:stage III sporulation protein AG [Aliibacillus thermotolerans]|uniref:Stage III sporulation protein AG n=1 Tax=Aliibacillus thermotolerans TaxID=1834418 RepID=A0ABW0U8W2_9BACI|nr:stage III sporulation protein AG [Aliibacillus thermotolerans]MDA3131133.1 stage III sporulation protein AG [Aliibacillus thermotolerans]